MDRRRFDHLYEEICVTLGRVMPRYALWLHMSEVGLDPEKLSREDVMSFCSEHLQDFLFENACELDGRPARKLRRRVERYDPKTGTPYEQISRLSNDPRGPQAKS